jgi:hypothetical protein
MLAAGLTMSAQPLAAATVQDCYDYVITKCADAMEDANFVEKVAIGIVCSSMLAGCTVK